MTLGKTFRPIPKMRSSHSDLVKIKLLHPIPVYYINSVRDLVCESFVVLSDDLTHDYLAVDAFRRALINHLRNIRQLKITDLHEWSDGAGHEYKSVNAFRRMSKTASELKIRISSNFFGSEHGKADSDGETGALKLNLSNYILSNPKANIKDANDIKKFGDGNMTDMKISEYKHLGVVKAFCTFHFQMM